MLVLLLLLLLLQVYRLLQLYLALLLYLLLLLLRSSICLSLFSLYFISLINQILSTHINKQIKQTQILFNLRGAPLGAPLVPPLGAPLGAPPIGGPLGASLRGPR